MTSSLRSVSTGGDAMGGTGWLGWLRRRSHPQRPGLHTDTCPTCGEPVEMESHGGSGGPMRLAADWPPNEAERRAACAVHGHEPYNHWSKLSREGTLPPRF
jgi:hypothetical protein